MKADLLTQVILPFSLFIIVLGMGLALKLVDFTRALKQPKSMGSEINGEKVKLY